MNTMLDIEKARRSLPMGLPAMPLGFTLLSAVFLLAVFGENKQFDIRFVYVGLIMGGIGLVYGYHHKYKSACGTTHAVLNMFVVFFIFELALLGGVMAMTAWIAGAPELRILSVITAALTLIISIIFGMQQEAGDLKWWKTATVIYAKEKFTKQIDFAHRTFQPLHLEKIDNNSIWKTYGLMIACVGSANIPLMFQIFTGDKQNSIYFVLPLAVGLFVYLNVTTVGRVLLNIILLRRLEASLGYSFINADYEEIQDLRRTFFLSRWLMKDYIKPTDDNDKPVKRNKRAAQR